VVGLETERAMAKASMFAFFLASFLWEAMVEGDLDPQLHKQGARYCLVFSLIFAVRLSNMCDCQPSAESVGMGVNEDRDGDWFQGSDKGLGAVVRDRHDQRRWFPHTIYSGGSLHRSNNFTSVETDGGPKARREFHVSDHTR
jgi:hypothetical protein